MLRGILRAACLLPALFAAPQPASAAGNNVRIMGLSDVSFGSLTNLSVDAVQAQNLCLYSSSATSGYRITGTGTGSGNAFTLASGSDTLAYEVQWSSSSGQTSGAQLTAGVPLTGQTSTASNQNCNPGAATTASLIVILRASALQSATAGSYSGVLTLTVAPE